MVAKHSTATATLAKLKYMADDLQCQYLSGFFSVLKHGVSYLNLIAKYQATGENAALRVQKDAEDKFLAKVGASIEHFLRDRDAFNSIKQQAASQEESNPNPLYGLEVSHVFGDGTTEWETFFDSLAMRATNLKSHVEKCMGNLKQVCQGMEEGSEHFWRAGLDENAGFPELKTAAKPTLKKLDGAQLKSAVEKHSKAGFGLDSDIGYHE